MAINPKSNGQPQKGRPWGRGPWKEETGVQVGSPAGRAAGYRQLRGKVSAQAHWWPEALPSSRGLAWRLWEEVIRPPRLPFTRWLLSGGV